MDPLVMYIVINQDLKMGSGKIAAQVGHVVHHIVEEITKIKYETVKKPQFCSDYDMWNNNGCTKIVLKAPKEKLLELMKLDKARYILDAGKTQVEPGSLTVVGFYPSREIKKYVSSLKLL